MLGGGGGATEFGGLYILYILLLYMAVRFLFSFTILLDIMLM